MTWRSPSLAPGSRGRLALMIALLGLAFLAPRLLALHDLPFSWHFGFGDGPIHYIVVDKMAKLRQMPESERQRLERLEVTPERSALVPRGVHWLASLWAGSLGPMSIWTTQLTNGLFTLLMVLGMIGLGAEVKDLRLGLWAALLVLLCPALAGASWYLSLDYPLVAMTTCGLYLLIRTRGLTRWPFCLALALWSVLGLSVKMSYGLFLVLPGIVALIQGLRRPGLRLRAAASCLLMICATVGLTMWLQGLTPGEVLSVTLQHVLPGRMEGIEVPPPWSVSGVLAVPLFVASTYTVPLLVLALPGLVLFHLRRRPLILAMLWGSLVLWTLMTHKLARYIYPLYPVLCLATVWWVQECVDRRWRTVLMAGLATVFAVLLVVAHLYPPPWLGSEDRVDMRMPSRAELERLREGRVHPECDLRQLLDTITVLARRHDRRQVQWVGTMWDKTRVPISPPPFVNIAMLSAQVLPHRYVELLNNIKEHEGKAGSSLIIVHEPELDPRSLAPSLRLLDRAAMSLSCGKERRQLQVSSYLSR